MPVYPGPSPKLAKSSTVTARTFNTASTTFVDVTGMSVTITPTSTTRKVLVTAVIHGGADGACSPLFQLMRDGVHIGGGSEAEGFLAITSAAYPYSTTIQFLDSPASVAALVYKLQMKVSTPFTATGGTITTSGGYTIHTFTSSGTFTPTGLGVVDALVVAGGGGGKNCIGGGGGAGGMIVQPNFAVAASAYTVTVGAGGAGGGSAEANGTQGGNSIFSSLTAIGGGLGQNGTGGSGGGGARVGATYGLGTSGQGNNGGIGGAEDNTSGGGGGAGAVGGNATANTKSGNGGAGVSNSYSGSAVTYAGGGGGGARSPYAIGTGGAGGGGNGGVSGVGANGTANTGGGGGGGGYNGTYWNGGAGGSGIVIIRYPTVPTFYINRRGTDDTLQGISTITVQEVEGT